MARNEVFTTIRSEGGLLPTDLLARVRETGSGLPGTTPAAYHLGASERLNEAITRSWNRLVGAWKAFEPERVKAGTNNVATGATRQQWLLPLFQELNFGQLQTTTRVEIGEKEYPISHRWGSVPVHLVGTGVALDRRSAGVRGAAAMSPHGMVQELLNRSDDYLWGIVSNGLVLRLLRDNSSLTRPAYLQFDLEAMFDGEVFADFVVLWLTCHQSRFEADIPEKCLLEAWAHEAVERGTRALDQLRVGVEEAIASLGEGFLAHPANTVLRNSLEDGVLDKQEYYRELLRLVYRLLFLLVTESRDLLLMPDADETIRARYRDHYGVERLRNTADQVRGGPHGDHWQSLQLVFEALGRVQGEPALGLPGLGGFLWEGRATPHIGECHLANEHLFRALRALSMVQDGKVRRRVDYGDLDSQELGSVYESLLELHPVLDVHVRSFSLSTAGGNERKTTGAYYTPDELVEELLDSALAPVLDDAEAADDPEQALLDVTVLDPACGSGHFLIAAGRRIATRLARVRAEVGEPSPAELTTAMRDVVRRCLHGIDVQEMAVELCKVSLWMAAAEPGKPLSFLEHRIVCGNGLLGTTPRLIAEGIPDEAFKPLTGDDKEVVKAWKAINKRERQHPDQLQMSFTSPEEDLDKLTELTERLDALPDDDLMDLERKQQAWSLIKHGAEMARAKFAADAWCAAFVAPKAKHSPVVTSRLVAEASRRLPSELDPGVVRTVSDLAKDYQFLHPHLAFPEVFRVPTSSERVTNDAAGWSGGFSVVLGNPPWERVKLQEKEFFAERRPEIAHAASAAIRAAMIHALSSGDDLDQSLMQEFTAAVRRSEGEGHFLRASGRYPLCGRGDVNTYAVFAESMRENLCATGLLGVIVPSGIATDDTTKHFFTDLVDGSSLVSLYDFENREKLFAGVDSRMRFCLLTLAGSALVRNDIRLVFFARTVADLADTEKQFTLGRADFLLLNPITRTCPVFRTARDAEVVKAVYRRIPPLVNHNQAGGGGVSTRYLRLIDYSDHKASLRSEDDDSLVPVYEGKMIGQFDHRYMMDPDQRACLSGPNAPGARSYVERELLAQILEGYEWDRDWFLAVREVARSDDARTVTAAIIPKMPVFRNTLTVVQTGTPQEAVWLLATMNTFMFDYLARCGLSGIHLSYRQLVQRPVPLIAGSEGTQRSLHYLDAQEMVRRSALELCFNDTYLAEFAGDLLYSGEPFPYDTERRSAIRAELDALFFHLYGIERNDADYILDTFPIVRRKDEAELGEYRTKRLILEIYDEMAEAERAGTEYQTRLDPPPADPSLCHPESTRPDWAK